MNKLLKKSFELDRHNTLEDVGQKGKGGYGPEVCEILRIKTVFLWNGAGDSQLERLWDRTRGEKVGRWCVMKAEVQKKLR